MANYLEQVGSTYYFHRSVPKALRPYLRSSTGKKRTDFKISLGTKDRGAAKARIPFYVIQTNRIFSEARQRFESGEAAPSGPSSSPLSFEKLEAVGDAYEDAADYWEKCLARHPDDLSVHESAVVDLLRAARDAKQASPPPTGGFHRAIPESGLSILGLYEGFASQPGLRAETIKQYRSIVLQFISWLGFDDALKAEPADIVRWRNHLSGSLSKRGTSFSPKTINTSYLTAVNLTFAYGLNNLLIPANPCQGIARVRAAKPIRLREKDFTPKERTLILLASSAPQAFRNTGNTSPEYALARRWVPWLCAYTGARISEITQLRGQDVSQIDGVWCIRITPEAGSVKTDTARVVPIHEHLIEQGFPAVALAAGEGPIFYNPNRARGGSARGQYKRTGMRIAAWIKSLGIDGVRPNHGWRHTFKTISREAGIEERAADYIQGHASKGVGRSYGSNTIPALVRQLQLFPRYPVECSAWVPPLES